MRGDILVSAAGVATNFVLSFVFAFLYVLLGLLAQAAPGAAPVLETAQRMMKRGIWLNLILCFFNLIPIPPLDGSHLLYHALPPSAAAGIADSSASAIFHSSPCSSSSGRSSACFLTPAAAMMNFLGGGHRSVPCGGSLWGSTSG